MNFKVADPISTSIRVGIAPLVRALVLIKCGEAIKYKCVTGLICFDQFGEVTGPLPL